MKNKFIKTVIGLSVICLLLLCYRWILIEYESRLIREDTFELAPYTQAVEPVFRSKAGIGNDGVDVYRFVLSEDVGLGDEFQIVEDSVRDDFHHSPMRLLAAEFRNAGERDNLSEAIELLLRRTDTYYRIIEKGHMNNMRKYYLINLTVKRAYLMVIEI